MNLCERYKRWRHGHGFGVHSPLAYRLITSVLPDIPPYYGDTELRKQYTSNRRQRIARIILRLIAHFQPQSISVDAPYHQAVRIADPRIRVGESSSRTDMEISVKKGMTIIRIGQPDDCHGPLILENQTDLQIVIYRKGLSPCTIITTL